MTVTAGSVVVVPMIVMAIMVVVGVMAFLSAVIVTLMVSMVMAFMIFVVVVVVLVFVVGFRHILLRLFIEGHFAARRAEVVGSLIVFTLTAGRAICIHIHLADWVNRCSHSISSD